MDGGSPASPDAESANSAGRPRLWVIIHGLLVAPVERAGQPARKIRARAYLVLKQDGATLTGCYVEQTGNVNGEFSARTDMVSDGWNSELPSQTRRWGKARWISKECRLRIGSIMFCLGPDG